MQPFIHQIVDQISDVVQAFKHNLLVALAIIGVLVIIHIVNNLTGNRLTRLGIIPRHIIGLRGIIFSPFLHGSWNHLILNSLPLLILSSLLMIHGLLALGVITVIIVLVGGVLTWCFGKHGLHIGASSLIMGYWSYTLTQAIVDFNVVNLLISLLCLFYLGHLIINIFPSGKKGISWEGHFFGALAGVLAVYLAPLLINYGQMRVLI